MGGSTLFSFVWCVCWIHLHTTLGSEVKLSATPVTVAQGLTEILKVRCSLPDTAAVTGAGVVVGRQVSSTNYDIQHVNSIIVSRVNTDETITPLAQIITSENAKVLSNVHPLTAAGTLAPNDPADPEYLELTWTNPGEDQSGRYFCEVNGLDIQGHGVMLKKTIAVNAVDPEVKDLVKEIQDLKAVISDLKSVVSDLKTTVANQAPHNEEGSVSCVDSYTWPQTSDGVYYRKVQSVTFHQPYASPPTIVVVAVGEDADANVNDRYTYYVSDVTTTGFNIACNTWADSHISNFVVRWTSFVS